MAARARARRVGVCRQAAVPGRASRPRRARRSCGTCTRAATWCGCTGRSTTRASRPSQGRDRGAGRSTRLVTRARRPGAGPRTTSATSRGSRTGPASTSSCPPTTGTTCATRCSARSRRTTSAAPQPWYAMSLLMTYMAPSPGPSMDVQLVERAKERSMPVDSLETLGRTALRAALGRRHPRSPGGDPRADLDEVRPRSDAVVVRGRRHRDDGGPARRAEDRGYDADGRATRSGCR